MKIYEIRHLIRRILRESSPGASVVSDPTDVSGFYNYDIERGADIHGFWYKSPGRGAGTDGDPGRPENSSKYIGLEPPQDNQETSEENIDEPEIES